MSTAQNPRSKTTWVVVADEAIARILRWNDSGDALEPVEELTDPDAHASGQDLRRDAYGRRAATGGVTQRHGAGTTASAGEEEPHQEAQAFARQVARHITQAWDQHRFDGLQIAAAPRFLGLLRQSLDPQVCNALQGRTRQHGQTKSRPDRSSRLVLCVQWSGWRDSNSRPLAPHASALPGCATPRRSCAL
jgi:protein required for attachment to host cells